MAQDVASMRSGGGARVRTTGGRWAGTAVLLAAAALATAPLVIRGTSCGNDFDFHLVSWIDALHAWRHGIVYPHWAPSANFNAGEPRFVFYPPLEWMLGAALGAVLPWAAVPAVLVFLILAGTGWATRALARQAMEEGPATLAGCLAIFSGYALFTVYERSAYAELAAGIWMPLILAKAGTKGPRERGNENAGTREQGTGNREAGTKGQRERGNDKAGNREQGTGNRKAGTEGPRERGSLAWWRAMEGVPALAVMVALAWLSNAPAGVMASYLLAALTLVRAGVARSWAPLARAACGVALGMALASVYLIPAAAEQRWADLGQALSDPGEHIEYNFLFGHHAGNAEMALHDAELARVSWIAVGMIAATLAGVVICWRRRRLPGGRNWWIPLALVPAGVLVLLLPVSLPVWNVLPKLRFLQFPWRWLVVMEAPLGVFVAAAVWTSTRRWMAWAVCGVACLAMTVVAARVYFTPCYVEDSVPGMLAAYRAGAGFEGTDEYSPEYADSSLIAMGLPGGCLAAEPQQALGAGEGDEQPQWTAVQGSCAQTFVFDGGNPEHWRIRGTAARAGWLILRLRAYPAWRVRRNGQAVTDLPRRADGLIAVPVTAGPLDVAVDWTATSDVWMGRAASALGLMLVTGLCALRWRRNRAQLS